MTRDQEKECRVGASSLLELTKAVFRRCGMSAPDAELLADSLVASDLRGVHSHGVIRVPEYVRKLTTGGVNPKGRPRVVRDSGACLVVDADNSMGQIGAHFAMKQAIARATATGIAAAAVRGSNHCGAMAYYAVQALPHDMIGIATTNALPVMAPWGGAERILGINPIAIAVPAGEELPIVYDAAFSGSSVGKIRVYQQQGKRLPEGWAMDREGRPTTDPTEALAGLMMPIGAFKGTAMSLIAGLISSLLSGAAYGTELGSLETGPRPGQDGHFLAAIRVAAFEDVARFKERVDRALRQIRECRPAAGFDRVYTPGEIEHDREQAYRSQGIPLNAVTLGDLQQVAIELGIEQALWERLAET